MGTVKKLSISANQTGQRLDNFLRKSLKGIPKSLLYKVIRDGQVRVNKCRIKPSYRIQCDDIIRIPPLSTTESTTISQNKLRESIKENILFEDKNLLVINKPSGIAVHSGTKIKNDIVGILREMKKYKDITLVHRIDKSTSGCLVLAKNYHTSSYLGSLFSNKKVSKKYIALLYGSTKKNSFLISQPIGREKIKGLKKMTVVQDGKTSITKFNLIKKFKEASLFEIDIKTGRTHQIRVHSSKIGHPVCGDTKYGNKHINQDFRKIGLKRIFLHSYNISFFYKKKFNFTAEMPHDLNEVLHSLKDNIKGK